MAGNKNLQRSRRVAIILLVDRISYMFHTPCIGLMCIFTPYGRRVQRQPHQHPIACERRRCRDESSVHERENHFEFQVLHYFVNWRGCSLASEQQCVNTEHVVYCWRSSTLLLHTMYGWNSVYCMRLWCANVRTSVLVKKLFFFFVFKWLNSPITITNICDSRCVCGWNLVLSRFCLSLECLKYYSKWMMRTHENHKMLSDRFLF